MISVVSFCLVMLQMLQGYRMGREGNTVWPPNSTQEKCLFFYAERTSQVKVFTFEFSTVGQFVGIQVESEETSKEEVNKVDLLRCCGFI